MENGRKIGILTVVLIIVFIYTGLAFADENSWSSGGPYDASVWSIAFHPTDSQRMYIGTLESFIFKTTDGGAEWFSTGVPPDADAGVHSVRDLKIHPFAPDTLFVATSRGAYRSAWSAK